MEIQLTQGKVALIDNADWPLVRDWKWFAFKPRVGRVWYAVGYRTDAPGKEGCGRTGMHRVIMGFPERVDHRNGNGLDNRRENLRVATAGQNIANSLARQGANCPFKGVTQVLARSKVRFFAACGGKYIGLFKHPIDAAVAFDDAARRMYGEFARLNFPRDGEQPALREPITPSLSEEAIAVVRDRIEKRKQMIPRNVWASVDWTRPVSEIAAELCVTRARVYQMKDSPSRRVKQSA